MRDGYGNYQDMMFEGGELLIPFTATNCLVFLCKKYFNTCCVLAVDDGEVIEAWTATLGALPSPAASSKHTDEVGSSKSILLIQLNLFVAGTFLSKKD